MFSSSHARQLAKEANIVGEDAAEALATALPTKTCGGSTKYYEVLMDLGEV
jgi:hypothetical protein